MKSDSTTTIKAPKKGPVGRPTKYDPNLLTQIEKICTLYGSTDEQLAQFLEVDVDTIYEWKKVYPEFSEVVRKGKDKFDTSNVESALLKRAIGYSHQAVKIFQHEGIPLEVPYTEHYPPDTKACEIWLNNRDPLRWKNKQEHEISGKDGAPIVPIINISVGALGGSKPEE